VQALYFSAQGSAGAAANIIMTHPLITSITAEIFVFTFGILHIPRKLVETKHAGSVPMLAVNNLNDNCDSLS
jgi:hypothetical protein